MGITVFSAWDQFNICPSAATLCSSYSHSTNMERQLERKICVGLIEQNKWKTGAVQTLQDKPNISQIDNNSALSFEG